MMGEGLKTVESPENGDTSSTEGLIEEEDEDKEVENSAMANEELDLLDSAFLRDGISLEQDKESSHSEGDSDGLYDFKDNLGMPLFPLNLDSKKNSHLYARQPRQSEFVYGKRYTARCVKRVDPSQLPSLMSLKIQPPEKTLTMNKGNSDDIEMSRMVQQLQKVPKARRLSPDPRWRSPRISRKRSRSPRRFSSRERVHRSPTGLERYRYWTGREYRSRNRSSSYRRQRHP